MLVLAAVLVNGLLGTTAEPLRFGAILPLSGAAGASGRAQELGLRMAERKLRDLGVKFEVLVRDSASNPEQGRAQARQLLDEGADALYSSFTQITREVSPLAAAREIPLLYDSCNCGFAGENDYAFQLYVDPRKECRAVAQRVRESGGAKAAFVGPDVPYASYCYEAMQAVLGPENVLVELENPDVKKNYEALFSSWARQGVGAVASLPIASDIAGLLAANESSGARIPFSCFAQQCLAQALVSEVPPGALAHVRAFDFRIVDGFASELKAEHPELSHEEVTAAAIAHDALVYAASAAQACSTFSPQCFVKASRRPLIRAAIASRGFGPDRILDYDTMHAAAPL